jgi:putative Mn2+ efflux pump MntP
MRIRQDDAQQYGGEQMGIGELVLLAIGLSMDAFAVSICKGLAMKKATLQSQAICGAWFGGFQALMPLIGFFLGTLFAEAIEAVDHWVAFILLGIIGINMLREAFDRTCDVNEDCDGNADLSVKAMFVMAVATSIDALAVGISLAMAGNVNIFMAIGLIGVITFVLSCAGVKIGNIFGSRFEKKAQIAGGVILILLGTKILLEHLGVL